MSVLEEIAARCPSCALLGVQRDCVMSQIFVWCTLVELDRSSLDVGCCSSEYYSAAAKLRIHSERLGCQVGKYVRDLRLPVLLDQLN